MNKDNMIQLSKALESMEKDNFDLRYFYAAAPFNVNDLNDDLERDSYPISPKAFITHQESKSCGTSACIAGWAVLLFENEAIDMSISEFPSDDFDTENILRVASELLGLRNHEAEQLFYANENSLWSRLSTVFNIELDEGGMALHWSSIHPKHAAEVLRMLVDEEISFLSKQEFDFLKEGGILV